MKTFSRLFNPTSNRRLNELVGFLLCVSALLLFLALASYSPLDPSFNSASVLTTVRGARNWIGIVGAVLSDLCLQAFGVGAFLLPLFPALLGARWFRSRKVQSPVAKSLGGFWLLIFVPAFLALLPGQVRWLGVIPMEGLVGPDRRRLPDSLPESRRSVHRVRDSACRRTLLVDRVLVFQPAGLDSDTVCIRLCPA